LRPDPAGPAPAGVLEAVLRVRVGSFEAAAELRVRPGEVLAVVGPNGAGKTTVLRALAGLAPVLSGRVTLGETVLEDHAEGRWMAPEHRPVGYVFADHRLFPHLSALDNVAFGLRARGMRRARARAEALAWLERLGIAAHAGQRPGRLSSGQQQRVALARALAPRPRLLLLDEPLSALDAGTRAALRGELRRLVAEYDGCCLAVTHDPLDALVLADRIAVMEDGAVVQTGTPAEIARHPRTAHVARLVGLNLYRGEGAGTAVELPGGVALTVAGEVRGPSFAAFPPTAVAIHRDRPQGSPRNTWPATVTEVEPYGGTFRVRLAGDLDCAADVTAAAVAELDLVPGRGVWAAVKATEIAVYPA
jgi:molybdate transport system ATP-binding protein